MNIFLGRFIVGLLAGTIGCGLALADNASQPGPTAGAQVDSDSLTEILVTAQRRSERLVDVPISITTVGADQLQAVGITDTSGLTSLIPGLTMDRTGTNSIP